jgi:hypothetical protein
MLDARHEAARINAVADSVGLSHITKRTVQKARQGRRTAKDRIYHIQEVADMKAERLTPH